MTAKKRGMTSGYDKEMVRPAKSLSNGPEARRHWGRAILKSLERKLVQARVSEGILLIILLLALMAQIHEAWTKPFWADELLTVYVSSLRSPALIWDALRTGVDAMPFTYHWLTGEVSVLPLDPHIAFRLLSIFGYLMGMTGVYAFTAKRLGPISGLIAGLLLALSPFEVYAHEARSYALLVGFLGVAAALWQRIDEGWWFTFAFPVCLGLAVASHHLAIVALGCFGIAELTVALLYRRLRWRIWLSLAVSSIPFLVSFPLLLRYRTMFGAHFWSKPTWGSILSSYSQLEGLWGIYSVVLVLFIGFLSASILFDHRSRTSKAQPGGGFSIPEIFLSVGFLLFPVLLVTLTMIQHSGYTERYAWPLILGFVFAFVFVVRRLAATSDATCLLCALMIVFVYKTCKVWSTKQSASQVAQATLAERLESLKVASTRYGFEETTPVVIGDDHEYMTTVYYSDLSPTSRYYFLTDPEAALRFSGTDSADINMRALNRAFPSRAPRLEDANVFIEKHKKFIVWATSDYLDCWLPDFLIEKGVRLRLIQDTDLPGYGRGQVYLAEADERSNS
jgi:hypothetical protein